MSDSDVIDPTAHERLLEWGGPKLLSQMIRLFLENTGERMELIASGFRDGEVQKVEHGAHSRKSSAANVGAERLRVLAADMEGRASRGELEAAEELHEAMQTARAEAEHRLREIERGLEA
ncbi:MAG TPA: Hpt domain-containing protein [Longimicrobiales bacterium]|nr:Hpt domain-containing protein [Longimicrobiales bacterium]